MMHPTREGLVERCPTRVYQQNRHRPFLGRRVIDAVIAAARE